MTENLPRMIFSAVGALSAGVFLVLAAVTVKRGPRVAYLRWWAAYCIVTCIHLVSIPLADWLPHPWMAEACVRTSMSLASLEQFLLLAFAATFSTRFRGRREIAMITLVVSLGLVALLWTTDLVVAGVEPSEMSSASPVPGRLMPVFMVYNGFTWVFAFAVFTRTLRRSQGKRRVQAAYMMAALAFGLVGSIGFLLPGVTGTQTLVSFLPGLLIVLLPITVTYAVVRHRLWDIRTIAHRTAAWAVLLVVLLVPLYGIIRGFEYLDLPVGAGERALLVMLLFVLGFLYMGVLKPRIDHLFQRRGYDRRKVVDDHAASMATLLRPAEVVGRLLSTVRGTLYPGALTVIYCREPGGDRVRESWTSPEVRGEGLSRIPSSDLLDMVRGRAVATEVEREEGTGRDGVEVLVPLIRGDDLLGVLAIGRKRNLRPWSREDLDLLDLLASSTAMGLSNALLFERVDQQRRDLEDLTERLEDKVRERTREIEGINEQLKEANEGLKQLDRLKSRFFADISHELRTPLSLILMPLGNMVADAGGDMPEGQRRGLETIRRQALILLKLVNDILDLSRLEESRMRLRVDTLDLRSLVDRIVTFSKPLAERKRIEVAMVSRGSVAVEADEEKLERVVVNLVTNALKYTDPGGRVDIRVERSGDDAVVRIEDSGIGIPEEDLPRVFDRFHRVEADGRTGRGGTGIGLALVKEIVELHGGTVSVASREGEGSVFSFAIPRSAGALPAEVLDRRVEQAPVAVPRREDDRGLPEWNSELLGSVEYRFIGIENATERRLAPRDRRDVPKDARLLVVDDNADVLRFLHLMLSESYEVLTVQEGVRAWELVADRRPDLVITDLTMPGLDGIGLCRRIKDDPRTNEIPVILLTAQGDTDARIASRSVGADEYITKPFEREVLLGAIRGLLEGRSQRAEAAAMRRSASLETLLAGMAHELRNATHQMKSAHAVMARMSRRVVTDPASHSGAELEEARRRLERMEEISRKAFSRIGKVVRGLQHYASGHVQARWGSIPVDDVLRQEVATVTSAEHKGVNVDLDLASGSRVKGPVEEFRQVVINVFENAVHAVDPAGRVRIATRTHTGRVRITVEDDGCGIPAAELERVFDPFYTTRDPGEGMGLGLALSKRTLEDMGGTIQMRSREGRGTMVTIEVPTSDSQEVARSA